MSDFGSARGVRLPPKPKAFYAGTNGTAVSDHDDEDGKEYCFWRLSDLRAVEGDESKMYFLDVNQSSYQFAIETNRNDDGAGAVYVVPGELIKVADSFGEFIDLYIADDEAIFPVSWYE